MIGFSVEDLIESIYMDLDVMDNKVANQAGRFLEALDEVEQKVDAKKLFSEDFKNLQQKFCLINNRVGLEWFKNGINFVFMLLKEFMQSDFSSKIGKNKYYTDSDSDNSKKN